MSDLMAVFAEGFGVFVKLDESGRVHTSPDAEVWTERAVPHRPWVSVEYLEDDDRFGTVFKMTTEDGAHATSPDGITWTMELKPSPE